VYGKIKS